MGPGTLKAASRSATKRLSSSARTLRPLRRTTAAATSSPSVGCGTPNAAACATAGCSARTSSTSRGEIFSPPRLISSFRRPVMNT